MTAPVQQCQPDNPELRQHTPTPWANCEGAIFRVIDARGFTVATVASDSDLRDQWAPNAAFIVEAVNSHAALKSRVEELTKALEWQPIETYPNDNSIVLTANPDEGTLPVVSWKVEDTWYHQDLRQKKPLDPQPTLWMAWPKMPRASMMSLEEGKSR